MCPELHAQVVDQAGQHHSSLAVQAAEQRRAALLEAALAAMRAEVKQYAEEQRTAMQEEAAQEVHEALEEWAEGKLAELQAARLAELQAQVSRVPLGGDQGCRGAHASMLAPAASEIVLV